MQRGLPRALMTDNGAAMMAEEFTAGLPPWASCTSPRYRIRPTRTPSRRTSGRVEGRLMAMLEGEDDLTLELLNNATPPGSSRNTTAAAHRDRRHAAGALSGRPQRARPCPVASELTAAFRIELTRTQRRTDGTVSLHGRRFEIPSRYRHLNHVHLRYARWDLSGVDLIDARTGAVLCSVNPLDKAANADGQRRALDPPETNASPTRGIAPLLRKLLAEYAATGLPPAYLHHRPGPP